MSRKNFGAKPLSLPQPVWMIATYDENGHPDCMNAAWGGISESNEITACIDDSHQTTKNFLKTKAFTISMATVETVKECDYLGIASGNKVTNKLEVIGFSTTRSELVNAPIINELPLCLECKVKSYDEDTCRLVGEIVNVSVDETYLTEGKVDLTKINPICFDPFNHAYHAIGDKVADAFKAGKEFIK